jgi:hypothetical protein
LLFFISSVIALFEAVVLSPLESCYVDTLFVFLANLEDGLLFYYDEHSLILLDLTCIV